MRSHNWITDDDVHEMIDAAVPPAPVDSVADWCCQNLFFDEASYQGPFKLDGHEFWRDVIECFNRADVQDVVIIAGSQTRKTGVLMGGVTWCLLNDPCGMIWVFPNKELARKTSRQRFMKLLRASPPTRDLIPHGAARHDFATLEMMLGSSVVNFVGSNSPANLASQPCRRVLLDEMDKFSEGVSGEADAVNLAEQRTKDMACPQRWKTTTPTTVDGLGWTEFSKGNQCRYFVPCPGCGAELVFAWSKEHTVFNLLGNEAFVGWDPGARSDSGAWDMARVESTAHVICPKCGRRIEDHEKAGMVKLGRWVPTTTSAASGFLSFHLPSLYSTSPETTWGKMAVRFLNTKGTAFGLQGFVNGDLAEPFLNRERIQTLAGSVKPHVPLTGEWLPILTVDVQQRSPFFWFVVRKWKDGSSIGIDAGSLETWEEVHAKQLEHGIPDTRVFVDSGDRAAEVYQRCWQHHDPAHGFLRAEGHLIPMCWTPLKGDEGRKMFFDSLVKVHSPVRITRQDPFLGHRNEGQFFVELVTFRTDWFKDILEALRDKRLGATWEVEDQVATEVYRQHLTSEENRAFVSGNTGRVIYKWAKVGGTRTPNHLLDCEVMQVVGAFTLGLFKHEAAEAVSP